MTSAIDVIDKYVTPVWYVVGVPGNLLAFIVWTQRKMRASSGCYLAALALNDCIFLLLQVCSQYVNRRRWLENLKKNLIYSISGASRPIVDYAQSV